MRFTFLGTGPASAIPRPGHRDVVCRDARRRGSKSKRTRSAALLETRHGTVLIDAGPDIARQLDRERARCIDLVLLTHGHADAAGGLRLLDRWLAKRNPARTVQVFTDRVTKRRLERKYKHFSCIRLFAIQPFSRIALGRLRITTFPVLHSATPGFPTVGWSFGQALAYASDVAALPTRSRRLLCNVRTFILDAAAWFGIRIPSHLSTDAAIRLAGKLSSHRLVLTQIGHTYPPHALAALAIKHYAQVLRDKKPRSVILAYDGLRIRI